jgi:hypothetical protein
MYPRATTRPTAPDRATPLRWALTPPHAPFLRTSPRLRNGLRCRRVSYGSGAGHPTQKGSGSGTHLMALRGPWAMRIKKGLAAIGVQQGSCVTEASTRCAARSRYRDLQDTQAGDYRAML